MIDVVKRFFSKATAKVNGPSSQITRHDIRVATCALFVEIARIDEKFTEAETNRIVYVDGKMDRYEHYLMNKLQNLLRLSHDQLIAAKLKVLQNEK